MRMREWNTNFRWLYNITKACGRERGLFIINKNIAIEM